jgi:hypothetical protein
VNSPLLHRGWVAQETALAPVVLHFGVRQIYWECHEKRACETYPSGLPDCLGLIDPKLDFATGEDADDDRYRFWWTCFVESYSKTALTRPSDKLVAIAGLAKRMQLALKDIYLAGLWKEDLIHQLLWRVSRPEDSKRPSEYRAPSWSWAAVDGHVRLENSRVRPKIFAEIIHVKTSVLNDNSTGHIEEGSLRIVGLLKTMWLPGISSDDGSFKTSVNGQDIDMSIHRDAPSDDNIENLHCLPIRRGVGYTECLLLCPTGVAKGQFRRVGVSWAYNDNEQDILEKPDKNHHDWLHYEKFDGVRNYTISIV